MQNLIFCPALLPTRRPARWWRRDFETAGSVRDSRLPSGGFDRNLGRALDLDGEWSGAKGIPGGCSLSTNHFDSARLAQSTSLPDFCFGRLSGRRPRWESAG